MGSLAIHSLRMARYWRVSTDERVKNMNSSEPVGIVFPFIPEHARRFFEHQKSIFVKFLAHEPRKLKPGHILFFYVSRAKKEIVGDARITEIDAGTMDEILREYGRRPEFFLTEPELATYVGKRKSRKMLVLCVRSIRKYRTPVKLDRGVTMAGMYMTGAMLKRIRLASR
jgi:hypothetical protein